MQESPDLTRLCRQLDYQFRDLNLLKTALTHRSASSRNNERLEFLGDAILGQVISIELFDRFPDATEGELSRMRASLVKGVTLAKVSRELDLGEYLNLGTGELKSGGFRRDSILADAFEAIIGAVYLDSNRQVAHDFVMRFLSERLQQCNPDAVMKDPKTRLQEYLQAQGEPLPDYEVVAIEGQAHEQTFKVACHITRLQEKVSAIGSSRRKAEQLVAQEVLNRLGV
ncbi:MAG: ribonuclease III [Gammaproteobacteria bacterium]|nr:ribonuclease III [Gammaproteobacteria bacterium]